MRSNFFAELKRRNVYKVAIAYIVASWLLIQAASIFFPAFDAPASAIKILIIVLVLGFPIALAFSWAFEITPEGIKRESEVEAEQSITHHTGRKIIILTVILAIIAAGLVAFQIRGPKKSTAAQTNASTELAGPISEKSIAVLPFDNLSSDKENAYFAEGVQDEILTRLSKIAALKVISRTSTQKYKSAPDNLRDIGKQLGVANILEGSVQKVANAVHVNVQLIRAATDEHIWAESYNRNLNDVFGVEGEVAGAIADALKAKLSGSEKQIIAAKPTNNPEAYDAYLRGLALYRKGDFDNSLRAEPFLEQAVRLDPSFALAWALLARADAYDVFNGDDTSDKRKMASRAALDTAVRLQPDLAEVQLAQGYYQYYVERDYDAAANRFKELLTKWPNNAEILEALGYILRRQGHWEQSEAYLERAITLDPLSQNPRTSIAISRIFTRDFPAALRGVDEALNIWPDNVNFIALKALTYLAQGQLDQSEAVLAGLHPRPADYTSVLAITNQARFERKYTNSINQLEALLQVNQAGAPDDSSFCALNLNLGDLRRLSGDVAGAKNNYVQARDRLLAMLKSQPNNALLYDSLAQVDAGLDDREASMRTSDHAIKLFPITKDALDGPNLEADHVRILARFGDREHAIPALERLLKTPCYLTPAFLRLDPDFDQLRGDPRFDKLCQQPPK